MSNYEFKHLQLLSRIVADDGRLVNEDYIFLTELRMELRTANEHMKFIDSRLSSLEQYA